MKNFNILLASVALLLVTGCVKPGQNTQTIYDTPAPQAAYPDTTQPIVYEQAGTTVPAGTTYEEYNPNNTTTTIGQPITYPEYGGVGTTIPAATSYPDPYATGGTTNSVATYPDPYAGQPTTTTYPTTTYPTTSYPSTPTSTYPSTPSVGQGGGIHLQVAALKDYYTAENYKNRLSLEPGLSAYVVRGTMNKVVISGIPSVAEANRLKERRFPGAFIVKGASSMSSNTYTPPADPYGSGSTGGVYTIDNPYGTSSASTGMGSGVGVQIGAFGSQGKAQSIANSQSAQYPAVVKKIGKFWKVILTGFSSRSAAKAHASRVGGFVVNY